jgi:hypothetical protein
MFERAVFRHPASGATSAPIRMRAEISGLVGRPPVAEAMTEGIGKPPLLAVSRQRATRFCQQQAVHLPGHRFAAWRQRQARIHHG